MGVSGEDGMPRSIQILISSLLILLLNHELLPRLPLELNEQVNDQVIAQSEKYGFCQNRTSQMHREIIGENGPLGEVKQEVIP